MRLADLIVAAGSTTESVAATLNVSPLLVVRIDTGRQPMPRELAARMAILLKVELWQVVAACPVNTDLTHGILYNAIPPGLGELVPAARIAPTSPVSNTGIPSPPPPTTDRQLIVFYDSQGLGDGSSILEQYLVTSDGSMSLLTDVDDTNDDTGANAGIFVPPAAPSYLVTLDRADHRVVSLDPDNFLSLSNVADASALVSSQLIAYDSVNNFVWVASPVSAIIRRFNPATLASPQETVALTGSPRALVFTGGFLYVLTKSGTDWRLIQVDPTPSSAHVTITSAIWTSSGDTMLAASLAVPASFPGTLFSGGDAPTAGPQSHAGSIIEWDVGPSAINPTPVQLSPFTVPDVVRSLVYDADSEEFWGTSSTMIFRCTVNGFVDFADAVAMASPDVAAPQIVQNLGLIAVPATTGLANTVRCYSMGATPTLLTSTSVGAGPNPTGQNNSPTSFALRPLV